VPWIAEVNIRISAARMPKKGNIYLNNHKIINHELRLQTF
jgi:hypothetical protein